MPIVMGFADPGPGTKIMLRIDNPRGLICVREEIRQFVLLTSVTSEADWCTLVVTKLCCGSYRFRIAMSR